MGHEQDPSDKNDQQVALCADERGNQGESVTPSSMPLTRSERRVLYLVSRSKTNREIAEQLRVTHATVKRHIENILRKLNLRNRDDAAIYALSVQRCPDGKGGACPLENWWKNNT